ncbi:MAG: TonB-dependent receptor plug domain-containing protein, partial [Candidatus Neomarinimicrobiota bacterium]
MSSLRIIVLVTLWYTIFVNTVKSEPLEITIYALRNSSDLTYQTYSYDIVEPKELNTVSSINMVQSGPDGQMTSLFTRGTNSNHTLITYNGIGIKDNSTPLGTDDISQHSFLGVDRVEVVKGPMSSEYGANAIGGVVNMVTLPNDEKSIDVSYGSNNTKYTTLKYGEWFDGTILDFSIQKKTSDGISVADGDEKDGYDNTNYHVQVSNGPYNFKKLRTHNKSDLDGRNDKSNYTADWQFDNNYISYKTRDT